MLAIIIAWFAVILIRKVGTVLVSCHGQYSLFPEMSWRIIVFMEEAAFCVLAVLRHEGPMDIYHIPRQPDARIESLVAGVE